MRFTESFASVVPEDVLRRYAWLEVRSAASILASSDPEAFADLMHVLAHFNLTVPYLLDPGGNKSALAASLDEAFRLSGWRETHMAISTATTLTAQPYRPAGERRPLTEDFVTTGDTHKVDNVLRRVALDVEWSAKDGNLDRDLAAFRALYDAGIIDVGVIVTRVHADTHYLANWLAHYLDRVNIHPIRGHEVPRLGTATTTNLERLAWRVSRGDAGGCPVLGIGIAESTYTPGVPYIDPDGVEQVAPTVPPLSPDLAEELAAATSEDPDDQW